MDRRKTPKGFSESVAADIFLSSSNLMQSSVPESRQRPEGELKDPIAARKVQKADREKLRRDRLNEQFLELGNTLDPDKPKNDKANILTDTIQMLKDLTAEVNGLNAECAALSEESQELTLEKNELREEKASLKSDIENLNVQYLQRLGVMSPWTAIDPPVVMSPTYSFPVPVAVPPAPIPTHPLLQPFPFFGNQNPSSIASPCSTFIPYSTHGNSPNEQLSVKFASTSRDSGKQDSKSKSRDHQQCSKVERCDDSNDIATDLELKMPGSSARQDKPNGEREGKQSQRNERNITSCSSTSIDSSSQDLQDSSSNSIGDVPKSNG